MLSFCCCLESFVLPFLLCFMGVKNCQDSFPAYNISCNKVVFLYVLYDQDTYRTAWGRVCALLRARLTTWWPVIWMLVKALVCFLLWWDRGTADAGPSEKVQSELCTNQLSWGPESMYQSTLLLYCYFSMKLLPERLISGLLRLWKDCFQPSFLEKMALTCAGNWYLSAGPHVVTSPNTSTMTTSSDVSCHWQLFLTFTLATIYAR